MFKKITLCFFVLLTTPGVFAAEGDRVLIVVNDSFPDSVEVGGYYAAKRGVPEKNICHIRLPQNATVDLSTYEKEILPAVKKSVDGTISYIVLTKDVPFRLEINGIIYCLDAFLCFPFQKIAPNLKPYQYNEKTKEERGYKGEKSPFFQRSGRYFSNGLRFLVTRLDGANKDIAKGLVDRAIYGEANITVKYGKGYFDQNGHTMGDTEQYQTDLEIERACELSKLKGFESDLNEVKAEYGKGECPDALWFYGWYKYNFYSDAFSWKPGAVGIHLDSASCLSPRSGPNWVANALKRGITATLGTVNEPYLDTFTKADIFYLKFLNGTNFAESVYYATSTSKWMMCVIGDPLYNPMGYNPQRIKDTAPVKFLSLYFNNDAMFPDSEIGITAEGDKYTGMEVEYGTVQASFQIKKDKIITLKHFITVQDLKAGTEYFFRITLTDMHNNKQVKEGRFKTKERVLKIEKGMESE